MLVFDESKRANALDILKSLLDFKAKVKLNSPFSDETKVSFVHFSHIIYSSNVNYTN
jgi:hypothetical protein